MHIYSISIYKKLDDAKLLFTAKNLIPINFFQRSGASEFIDFFGKTIIERIDIERNICVMSDLNEYKCNSYVTNKNIGCVVISDENYPNEIAISLIKKVLLEFNSDTDKKMELILNDFIKKYQKLENVNSFASLNDEMDETKQILYKTIESVLNRGEKLDELVKKSEELSNSSKIFYSRTKKMNSCCILS